MTRSATAPTTGPLDQFDFNEDATVPGPTPAGGTYNSQAYADNGGPPGQIFTTPAGGSTFALNAVSFKGVADFGGGVFDANSTWGIRISQVSGTTLIPKNVVTGIPTTTGGVGNEWYTWAFTGADSVPLTPSTQYSFEVFSSNGWLGFDADPTDGYAGGTAFNSAGPARGFADLTTGNLADHLYDRTFHVAIGDHIFKPGDVDDDGDVDAIDFGIIRDHFKQVVGARNLGDLDGDGTVSFTDYLDWRTHLPAGSAAASLSLAVPEPATIGLVTLAIGVWAVAGRRNRAV
ncbi:MAG: PEP-CTERM sorting domain-containing protein [Pirellulales bacterium]